MKQGFSLIELLVVVAIIGVLAGAGIVGYQGYLDGVRADTAVNAARQVTRAAEQTDIALGGNLTVNDVECTQGAAATVSVADCFGVLADGLGNPYDNNANITAADFRAQAFGTPDCTSTTNAALFLIQPSTTGGDTCGLTAAQWIGTTSPSFRSGLGADGDQWADCDGEFNISVCRDGGGAGSAQVGATITFNLGN